MTKADAQPAERSHFASRFLIERWSKNFGEEDDRGSVRMEQPAALRSTRGSIVSRFAAKNFFAAHPQTLTACRTAQTLFESDHHSDRRARRGHCLHPGSKHGRRLRTARSAAWRKRARRLRGARRENALSRGANEKSGRRSSPAIATTSESNTLQENLERLGVDNCDGRCSTIGLQEPCRQPTRTLSSIEFWSTRRAATRA